ncbi:MAG: MFS transporter, partial [Vicinamibacterales bacterium]
GHLRGAAFGAQALASGAALAAGNVAAGWLWTAHGSQATFIAAAAAAAVAFGLVALQTEERQNQQ